MVRLSVHQGLPGVVLADRPSDLHQDSEEVGDRHLVRQEQLGVAQVDQLSGLRPDLEGVGGPLLDLPPDLEGVVDRLLGLHPKLKVVVDLVVVLVLLLDRRD